MSLPSYYYKNCSHVHNIIVLVFAMMFQIYDITLCDILYDYSHMPLHCLRNKRKTKQKKGNQIKINKLN